MKLSDDVTPIDISKVESISEIVKRFDSAGMSLGALSPEAHESLAEAMNTLEVDPIRVRAVKIQPAMAPSNRLRLNRWHQQIGVTPPTCAVLK